MISRLLDSLRFGILQVDDDWRASYANIAASRILGVADAMRLCEGQVQFCRARDRDAAVRWLQGPMSMGEHPTLMLPRATGQLSYILYRVASERDEAHFCQQHLLVLLDPRQASSVDTGVLTGVFRLTPAEACLASVLAAGASVQEFTAQANIANSTARRHLERIFLKTGARRQSDLIRLVLACSSPLQPLP